MISSSVAVAAILEVVAHKAAGTVAAGIDPAVYTVVGRVVESWAIDFVADIASIVEALVGHTVMVANMAVVLVFSIVMVDRPVAASSLPYSFYKRTSITSKGFTCTIN